MKEEDDLKFTQMTLASLYLRKNEVAKAVDEFNQVKHEIPTIEYLCEKARVLKFENKLTEAAETMNEARKLDLSDRYLANRAAKYYFRAGNVSEAASIYLLFAKAGNEKGLTPSQIEKKVNDRAEGLEISWYFTEYAEALLRLEKYDDAEKYAKSVLKIYNNYVNDLFDFHGYALGKASIVSYIKVIRALPNIAGTSFKERAEKVLAQIKEKKQN